MIDPDVIPVFAVFASISSNKLGDNKPDTSVVAIGIIASVPSEDSIVLASGCSAYT